MADASVNNPNPEALDEELVAYLDGELNTEAAQRIEGLLASDPLVRGRLSQLAASWDLLDQLPRATVDDLFTRTTVEMVAVAAEQEVTELETATPAKRQMRWIAAAAAAVAAGVVGFVAAAGLLPDRNDPLLADLPVVQNLELYRVADNIELIKQFQTAGMFAEDPKEPATGGNPATLPGRSIVPGPATPVPAALEQRRAWIESLNTSDKLELRRNFEKFAALSKDEQQQLRNFADAIRAEPNADALRSILQRYYEWLRALSPAERADLADLPIDQRAEKIRSLKHEQESRAFSRLTSGGGQDKDLSLISKWMRDFAVAHKAEIIEQLPPHRQRDLEKMGGNDERDRRRYATLLTLEMWRPNALAGMPAVSEADLKPLVEQLSPERKRALEEEPDTTARVQLLRQWLQAAMQSRGPGFGGGGWRGPNFGPSPERLKQFLDKELSPEDRDRLLKLDSNEGQRELRKLYMEKRWPGEGRPGPNSRFEGGTRGGNDSREGAPRDGSPRRGPFGKGDREPPDRAAPEAGRESPEGK